MLDRSGRDLKASLLYNKVGLAADISRQLLFLGTVCFSNFQQTSAKKLEIELLLLGNHLGLSLLAAAR